MSLTWRQCEFLVAGIWQDDSSSLAVVVVVHPVEGQVTSGLLGLMTCGSSEQLVTDGAAAVVV
jgi:hypothetical protein